MAAVRDKQQRDEAQVADLVRRGTPAAGGAQLRRRRHASDLPLCRAAAQCRRGWRRRAPRSRRSAGTIPANIRIPTEWRAGAAPASRATSKTSTGSVSEPVVRVRACAAQPRGRRHVRQPVRVERQPVIRQRHDGPHARHGRPRRLEQRGEGSAGAEGQARHRRKTRKAKPADKKEQPPKQTAPIPGAIRPKSEPRGAADRIDPAARVRPEHDQRRGAGRSDRRLRQPLRRLALDPQSLFSGTSFAPCLRVARRL